MNLGWEAGLEADKLHLVGLRVLVALKLTKPFWGKHFRFSSDPRNDEPDGEIPLRSLKLSDPLSIEDAMKVFL